MERQLSTNSTTSILLSGYLYKKSTNGEWQRRYFEVNGNYLTYYKTHKMAKLLAAVSLPQVGNIKLVGEIIDSKGNGYIFQIDLKDRQYLLRAQTMDEAQKWVDYLVSIRDGRLLPTNNPMNQSYNSASKTGSSQDTNSSLFIEPKATLQKSSRWFTCCTH
jgi:hypothetical protein